LKKVYILELSVELAKDQRQIAYEGNYRISLLSFSNQVTRTVAGPLFGLIVDSRHVNSLLEKAHFLVPTVVQVKQDQGYVNFNQHQTPDPFDVMSGGITRNSVRSGALYQDVKSSAPLSSFPLTVYQVGKNQIMKDTIDPIA